MELIRNSCWLTSEGYHVVRAIMPPKEVLGFDFQREKFVDRLLLKLYDHYTKKGFKTPLNVFVYCFSNGGALAYQKIIHKQLKLREVYGITVRGVILDSAPGKICFSKGYQAFLATKPPAWLNLAAHLMLLLCLALPPYLIYKLASVLSSTRYTPWVMTGLGTLLLHFVGLYLQYKQNRSYWDTLRYNNMSHPELYLFSKADHLCPADGIRELISRRSQLGCSVQYVEFQTSGHVRHFIDHNDQYSEAVLSFLSENSDRMIQ